MSRLAPPHVHADVDSPSAGMSGFTSVAPREGASMDTTPAPSPSTVSVATAWWGTVARRAERLASHSGRIHALFESLDPSDLPSATVEVGLELLTGFADDAEEIVAEMAEVRDGTSEHLLNETEPPVLVDLQDLARRIQTGLVAGDELILEKVAAFGDGPDALPDALIAIAERVRKTLPAERDEKRLVVALRDLPNADPAPVAG